jgi:hypothetical protein
MLLEKALKVGDGTVSVSELADLLDSKNKATKFEDLEALVYGSTPMVAALKAVRDRFKRMSRDVEMQGERVVLLLSDGEPTDGDPLPVAQELRESGITVVSCYVTSDDIADPRVLHSQRQLGWREGACLMFEAASTIDSKGPFARYLLGKGWHLDRDAKLFVQINHSDVLDEFIRVVGSPISRLAGSSLPQGR